MVVEGRVKNESPSRERGVWEKEGKSNGRFEGEERKVEEE